MFPSTWLYRDFVFSTAACSGSKELPLISILLLDPARCCEWGVTAHLQTILLVQRRGVISFHLVILNYVTRCDGLIGIGLCLHFGNKMVEKKMQRDAIFTFSFWFCSIHLCFFILSRSIDRFSMHFQLHYMKKKRGSRRSDSQLRGKKTSARNHERKHVSSPPFCLPKHLCHPAYS